MILLPSSIHEWMIIRKEEHPLSEMNLEELRSLVRTVNSEWVSNDDVLSDNVYYYCRQTDCFMLVDDIKKFEQNTKLTGKERQTGGLFFMGKI